MNTGLIKFYKSMFSDHSKINNSERVRLLHYCQFSSVKPRQGVECVIVNQCEGKNL